MKLLCGSLLAGLAMAAPPEKRKLTPREKAGLPLARHVVPLRARSMQQFRDMTPMGAPFANLPSMKANMYSTSAVADDAMSALGAAASDLGPVVDTVGRAENAAKGIEYVIEAELSGETFTLILDTGSTDTWLVEDTFQCIGEWGSIEPLANCRFGPALKGELVHGLIPDLTFNITYGMAGGPFLSGVMGFSDISVAGVHLQKQQVALAQRGLWRGDNLSSGILGLGLPMLTAALNLDSEPVFYDGFVTTMVKDGIDPIFAMALSRNSEESFLSLGGVPDIPTSDYASVPIYKTITGEYARYVIQMDQLFVEGRGEGARSASPIPTLFLIDSGTTLNMFPPNYATTINALFDPPALWDPSEGLFFVECNATAPTITFNIGGMNITTDPASMMLPQLQKNGYCATGVTSMGSGQDLYILGDTFMQELVVVFDISDKMEIRVANKL